MLIYFRTLDCDTSDFFFCHFYVVSISAFTQGWFWILALTKNAELMIEVVNKPDSVCLWSMNPWTIKKKVCQQECSWSAPTDYDPLNGMCFVTYFGLLDLKLDLSGVEGFADHPSYTEAFVVWILWRGISYLSTFWSFYPGGPELNPE